MGALTNRVVLVSWRPSFSFGLFLFLSKWVMCSGTTTLLLGGLMMHGQVELLNCLDNPAHIVLSYGRAP